jgi:hypothetical protein
VCRDSFARPKGPLRSRSKDTRSNPYSPFRIDVIYENKKKRPTAVRKGVWDVELSLLAQSTAEITVCISPFGAPKHEFLLGAPYVLHELGAAAEFIIFFDDSS